MEEEQMQQFLAQLQNLESYIAAMSRDEAALAGLHREAASAIDSIRGIQGDKNLETLVPMGLGAFAKAAIMPDDRIIINVGAGVAIEKDRDEAINYLEARLKEFAVALQDVSAKIRDATTRLEQGKIQFNQMTARPDR